MYMIEYANFYVESVIKTGNCSRKIVDNNYCLIINVDYSDY